MEEPLTIWIIAGYFVLLFLLIKRRGQPLQHPAWFLLRSFFPNWQFYAKLGYTPKLLVRYAVDLSVEQGLEAMSSEWQLVYPRAHRRIWHLVFNPDNNLRLYSQNLLDHLLADLAKLQQAATPNPVGTQSTSTEPAIAHCVSYQMVERLAAQVITHPSFYGITIPTTDTDPQWLQFCVCQHPTESPVNVTQHCVLVSTPQAITRC